MSIHIVKAFSTLNFLSRQKLAKNMRFGEMGSKCKVSFLDPQKAHPCAKHHLTIDRENWCRGLDRLTEEPKTSRITLCAFLHIGGERGLSYRDEILHRGKGPRRNHSCKFR